MSLAVKCLNYVPSCHVIASKYIDVQGRFAVTELMMAVTIRKIFSIAWLAVVGFVIIQFELVSPPAHAQTSENFDADHCLVHRQVGSASVYDNVCSQPVVVKYCPRTPDQHCQKDADFTATQMAANSSMTVYVPVETIGLARRACTERGEPVINGWTSLLECRPNASTKAEMLNAFLYFGPYEAAVWNARAVNLSAPGVGNCTAVINHGAMGLDASGARFVKEKELSGAVSQVKWSGACDGDGLISGAGTLSIIVDSAPERKFIGQADSGVLVGESIYDSGFGAVSPDFPLEKIRFDNGCNDWNGVRPNSCNASVGAVVRERFLTR